MNKHSNKIKQNSQKQQEIQPIISQLKNNKFPAELKLLMCSPGPGFGQQKYFQVLITVYFSFQSYTSWPRSRPEIAPCLMQQPTAPTMIRFTVAIVLPPFSSRQDSSQHFRLHVFWEISISFLNNSDCTYLLGWILSMKRYTKMYLVVQTNCLDVYFLVYPHTYTCNLQ